MIISHEYSHNALYSLDVNKIMNSNPMKKEMKIITFFSLLGFKRGSPDPETDDTLMCHQASKIEMLVFSRFQLIEALMPTNNILIVHQQMHETVG